MSSGPPCRHNSQRGAVLVDELADRRVRVGVAGQVGTWVVESRTKRSTPSAKAPGDEGRKSPSLAALDVDRPERYLPATTMVRERGRGTNTQDQAPGRPAAAAGRARAAAGLRSPNLDTRSDGGLHHAHRPSTRGRDRRAGRGCLSDQPSKGPGPGTTHETVPPPALRHGPGTGRLARRRRPTP